MNGLSILLTSRQGCVRACQLPPNTQFDHLWTVRKVPVNEQVDFLTYSTSSETYVLSTSSPVEFKLPENDELHPEWRSEGRFLCFILCCDKLTSFLDTTFLPEVPLSSIKVISPKTWSVIDR